MVLLYMILDVLLKDKLLLADLANKGIYEFIEASIYWFSLLFRYNCLLSSEY